MTAACTEHASAAPKGLMELLAYEIHSDAIRYQLVSNSEQISCLLAVPVQCHDYEESARPAGEAAAIVAREAAASQADVFRGCGPGVCHRRRMGARTRCTRPFPAVIPSLSLKVAA